MRTTCMGGWCHLRDKCKHHAPNGSQPVERFCDAKDLDAFEPLVQTRAAGAWKAPAVAPATWMVTA